MSSKSSKIEKKFKDEKKSREEIDIFRDPVTYLQHHWNSHGIFPGTEWNPKLRFGENWRNGVTRKPEETVLRDRCREDTKEFSRLKNEMTLSEFMKKHMKCSHFCLWFLWFDHQRRKML